MRMNLAMISMLLVGSGMAFSNDRDTNESKLSGGLQLLMGATPAVGAYGEYRTSVIDRFWGGGITASVSDYWANNRYVANAISLAPRLSVATRSHDVNVFSAISVGRELFNLEKSSKKVELNIPYMQAEGGAIFQHSQRVTYNVGIGLRFREKLSEKDIELLNSSFVQIRNFESFPFVGMALNL